MLLLLRPLTSIATLLELLLLKVTISVVEVRVCTTTATTTTTLLVTVILKQSMTNLKTTPIDFRNIVNAAVRKQPPHLQA